MSIWESHPGVRRVSSSTPSSRAEADHVSVDPLYRFSQDDIRERIRRTYAEVLEQTRKNAREFVWTSIKSVDELGRLRMAAMEEFLSDYPQGVAEKRYVGGELPRLPFPDRSFDLALCSHLLFLYSEHLSEDFHVESIKELPRRERRLRFPLLELGSKKSRHVPAVMAHLAAAASPVSVETVPTNSVWGQSDVESKLRGACSVRVSARSCGPSENSNICTARDNLCCIGLMKLARALRLRRLCS
jgi:hypothetical protein